MRAGFSITALLVVTLLAAGCGSEKQAKAPPAAKERDSLAKQLHGMSPEERTAYMRQHPEALQTLTGTSHQNP